MASFAAQVGSWATKVEGALEAVFKESAQELVSQLNELAPVATGFLRASLMASTTAMPQMTRANPGVPVPQDLSDIVLVIAGADISDTLFLGYTSNYAAMVHFGTQGRAPRPWVTMVAQRWIAIVEAKAAEVKARLGL
ncbi:HK97 gp10 family phage protein [Mesorhizobium sp. UC22_110]|uniref:HK97 gp10 family phage protein n=1 Tax=unclassified Mesorhizobium TaxID=325217 RepID=UPI00366C7DE2